MHLISGSIADFRKAGYMAEFAAGSFLTMNKIGFSRLEDANILMFNIKNNKLHST